MNDAKGSIATHLAEGYKYKVVKSEGGITQLKAINFRVKDSDEGLLYNSKIYSVLNTNLIDNYIIKEQNDILSIGIITLPFKYRPQNKESFETEFNINTTLNYAFYHFGNASVNIQGGTGFGSVRLDELNSNVSAEYAVNAISLGFILGPMVQYKNVQFGVYSGVDIINNNSQLQWSHNGKLCFGLGIGYNLFKIDVGAQQKKQ
ncbi:hypothetical protein [Chryseobacterium aquaticum]|uniref:hypothetical protein n=1 Tax=Chryseobacterium aquaticum TaxID=452084 RepID=UPI002FCB09BF